MGVLRQNVVRLLVDGSWIARRLDFSDGSVVRSAGRKVPPNLSNLLLPMNIIRTPGSELGCRLLLRGMRCTPKRFGDTNITGDYFQREPLRARLPRRSTKYIHAQGSDATAFQRFTKHSSLYCKSCIDSLALSCGSRGRHRNACLESSADRF
jgi:hypothetical protein